VKLVKEACLDGIEWAGDVHCLPGEVEVAKNVGKLTRENGLRVISYGSYYYAGKKEGFEGVLQTAAALETDMIRIWPGYSWEDSSKATEEYRHEVVSDIQRIADMSAELGINLSFECHTQTLTDTTESTLRLLRDVDRENVFTYWQAVGNPVEYNLEEIRAFMRLGKMTNIHLNASFGGARVELSEQADGWARYIEEIRGYEAHIPAFLMEFVKDNCPQQFLRDAVILKEMVGGRA
jgi:sugar phosphate isomerase/epimerase